MSTTVLMFALDLVCGHSKTVTRALEENAPSVGAIVNCLGCGREAERNRLVVTRVAEVELLSAGIE
jgi:hypothetical protein